MAHLSLYRKYRSQTFGDLIGQDHVVRTLQNGISSGRIAQAYLFTGPRGTGKTSTARLLAKALCCENGPSPTPSDDDPICRSIAEGSCPDVLEMDAASESGVDEVRDAIIDQIGYMPMICRYKIYIIDEVHDLSGKAFDALLKTIEEPPPHAIFILATTEFNKVPPTIRSRCQKFEFHRATLSDLIGRLEFVASAEGVEVEQTALTAMARMADGGYRDALTLLEQAILTAEDGKVTLKQVYDQLGLVSDEIVDDLLLAMKDGVVPRIMQICDEINRLGRDPRALLDSMMHRLAELTRAAYGVESSVHDATREAAAKEAASQLGRETLLRLRSTLAEAHRIIRDVTLPKIWLESELIRIATKPAQRPVQHASKAEPAVKVASPPHLEASASKPLPEPKPQPQKPPPKAAVVAEASKPGPEMHVASDDPNWAKVVKMVKDKSPTLAMRLMDVEVQSKTDELLTIEFKRETELLWVLDNPNKMGMIAKFVAEAYGAPLKVECAVASKNGAPELNEPTAVELPLQGAALHQAAKSLLVEEPGSDE